MIEVERQLAQQPVQFVAFTITEAGERPAHAWKQRRQYLAQQPPSGFGLRNKRRRTFLRQWISPTRLS